MYNRYIPQPDGSYRRNRVQDPGQQRRPRPPMREPEEPVGPGFTVDYIADTSEQLTKLLSRKVSLDVNKKGGRIVLEFYGSDDREALISNLVRMGKSWTSEN